MVDDQEYIKQLEAYIKGNCQRLMERGSPPAKILCPDCGDCPITFRIREERQAVAQQMSKDWEKEH